MALHEEGCSTDELREKIRRVQHTTDPAVVDEGVAAARTLASAVRDPAARASCRYNLGNLLLQKFQLTHDTGALDEAVEVHRAALAAVPAGHGQQRAVHLCGLGMALQMRFKQHGSRSALREAVGLLRDAVEAHPDHPERGMFLNELAGALRQQGYASGDRGALDEAVAYGRQAVASTAPADPRLTLRLGNLAAVLNSRFQWTGAEADLREAVQAIRRAVAVAQTVGVYGLELALQAVEIHCLHYRRLRDAASADVVLHLGARLARSADVPAEHRITAAAAWAEAAAKTGQAGEVGEAGALVAQLLTATHRHLMSATERLSWVSSSSSAVSNVASWLLHIDAPQDALDFLENSRAVLLGELVERSIALDDDYNADTAALYAHHPELYERLLAWNVQQSIYGMLQDTTGPDVRIEVPRELRLPLAQEGEELLAEIRSCPGFEDFLQPPSVRRLLAVAADGPVVVLNCGTGGGHALLITHEGLRTLRLPALTPDAVTDAVSRLEGAIGTVMRADVSPHERAAVAETMLNVLGLLWDSVTGPVLEALGFVDPVEDGATPPSVRWCPTGHLALLPLHAAGHHADASRRRDTVLDRVSSCYTPLVRTLLRPSPAVFAIPDDPLIVAMPQTPDDADLPGAAQEAELLQSLFPGARLLTGSAATRDSLLRALPTTAWLHVAGHARRGETGNPLDQHLLLYEGRVTVADLIPMRLHGAQGAFLSACETTQQPPRSAHEMVHLAGAFYLAGFRHVIGTLWPVTDRAGAALAFSIYRAMREDNCSPATAVRNAALTGRASRPDEPWLWAVHHYFGP